MSSSMVLISGVSEAHNNINMLLRNHIESPKSLLDLCVSSVIRFKL